MDEEDVLGSDNSIQEWSDAIANATSTPAGGAAAALATALAASLVAMVAGLTLKREKYSAGAVAR
jgi:formiminotetrahydrofolate cyclodeaminase